MSKLAQPHMLLHLLLDDGDSESAITILNEALDGGPVPIDEEGGSAVSQQASHESGRSYEPNETSQEIVALVAGLALLAVAAVLLVPRRGRSGSSTQPPAR